MKYTEAQILQEYSSLDDSAESHARIAQLVRMKNCPADILEKVACSYNSRAVNIISLYEATNEAMRNPRLPQDVIDAILQDLIEIGSLPNDKVPPQVMGLLDAILKNPSITTETLHRAFETSKKLNPQDREGDRFIFLRILAHPNLPPECANLALDSTYMYFHIALASNQNISQEAVQALMWSHSWEVRRELVRNKAIPAETFVGWIDQSMMSGTKRSGDQHRFIQVLIKRLPKGVDQDRAIVYLRSFNNGTATKLIVARHATDDKYLYPVALEKNPKIREALMKNEDAPEEYKTISALNSQR